MKNSNNRRTLTRHPKATDVAAASAEATDGQPATSNNTPKATDHKPVRHIDASHAVSPVVQAFLSRHSAPPKDFWYESGQLVGYTTPSAKQPTILCLKPIVMDALMVDADTGETVARVRLLDLGDNERTIEVPLTTLASRTTEAATGLAANGAPIMDLHVLRYLLLQAVRPDLPRITMLRRLGFSFGFDRSDPERLAYAEVDRVLVPRPADVALPGAEHDDSRPDGAQSALQIESQEGGPSLCIDPSLAMYSDAPSARLQAYGQHGTLQEWTAVIAKAEGNRLFIFALCVAFGGIINTLHGGEGGIHHCSGESSTGKTTALQLCGSVYGIAGDPMRSSAPTVVGAWNMTTNGMEVIARLYSGICISLDELGALLNALDVYGAVGGMSKTRMNRDLGAAPTQRWKLFAFSSGEKSIEQHVRDTLRRPMKAGEKVRAVDIPAGPMVEACPHDSEERRIRADAIKVGLEKVGGSAAPAFAQWLMDSYPSASSLCAMVSNLVNEAEAALVDELEREHRPLASHERRTVRHFAGILAGGWLAVDAGILPFSVDDVSAAVLAAANAWLEQDNPPDEVTLVLRNLRDYVLRHRGEMRNVEQDERDPRHSYGLMYKGLLLLTHQQFEDACGALNPHRAKQALRDVGILKHEPGKLTYRVNIQELGLKQAQFVALHYGRLFDDGEPPLMQPAQPVADVSVDYVPRQQPPANDDDLGEAA